MGWSTLQVTFGADDRPPLGITWRVDQKEGEMAIESIRDDTPAASKEQLRKGQMLTHIDEMNVEDIEQKDMTLKQVTKMLRERCEDPTREVTITLKEEVAGPGMSGADIAALSGQWVAQGEDEE